MSATIEGAALKKWTHQGATVKKWVHEGVTVWKSEKAMPDLSASVYNYNEYRTTRSGVSSAVWDLHEYESLVLKWSVSVAMGWPNAYGVSSKTTVCLQLGDGTLKQLGTKTGNLFTAGSTYTAKGTAEISLKGYTTAQLQRVRLYVAISDMNAPTPVSNSDRHDATASVTDAVAS